MIIKVSSETLQDLIAQLIDHIGCDECPLYDECQGKDDNEDCAKFFVDTVKIS